MGPGPLPGRPSLTGMGATAAKKPKPDWPSQIADRVLRRTQGGSDKVVCASGISPSGPVHLGNLRELLVPHFVAEEIKIGRAHV